MPIVIDHNPGQLIGDLAQNAGNFATGQANFQMQQQAAELQMRQAQMQRQNQLTDLQFQRENDLNRYRLGSLDQRGQIASQNVQSRQSIAEQRGNDAYDRAMLQHGDRQSAVAAGLQAKQEALQGQNDRFQQSDSTRRYGVDQRTGLGYDRMDQQQDQFDTRLDADKTHWDQQAANAPDHAGIMEQRAAELDFRRDQAMRSGDQRAAQSVLSSYQQEARQLQHEIDSDPYGLDPDKTAAARARLGVIVPKMERQRGILENRTLGQQQQAPGVAGDPTTGGTPMPAIGAIAPTSQPAQQTPSPSVQQPVQAPADYGYAAAVNQGEAMGHAQQIAQQGGVTMQAVTQARQLKDQAHALGISDPAAIKQFIQQHMHPALIAAMGG